MTRNPGLGSADPGYRTGPMSIAQTNAEPTGETIVGRIVPTRGGSRPRVIDNVRYCASKGCDTRLSKYNRYDHCYLHQPQRIPRVRGLKRKSRLRTATDT